MNGRCTGAVCCCLLVVAGNGRTEGVCVCVSERAGGDGWKVGDSVGSSLRHDTAGGNESLTACRAQRDTKRGAGARLLSTCSPAMLSMDVTGAWPWEQLLEPRLDTFVAGRVVLRVPRHGRGQRPRLSCGRVVPTLPRPSSSVTVALGEVLVAQRLAQVCLRSYGTCESLKARPTPCAPRTSHPAPATTTAIRPTRPVGHIRPDRVCGLPLLHHGLVTSHESPPSPCFASVLSNPLSIQVFSCGVLHPMREHWVFRSIPFPFATRYAQLHESSSLCTWPHYST